MTPFLAADPLADAPFALLIALFAGLFALSFVFSGTETAFFSLQALERRRLRDSDEVPEQRIAWFLERRAALITTILIGNETVNVAISATAAGLLAAAVPSLPWLSVALVTPALVLFSEITPKVVSFRYRERWARGIVQPLMVFYVLVTPVRWVMAGLVTTLSRLAGVRPGRRRAGPLREEDFLHLVDGAAQGGAVDETEREIIQAVFELDDLPVSRLMTPKPDIFSVALDTPWEALLEACRDARFSRVPVWGESEEDVLGVLLVKDLLRHRLDPPRTPEALRDLLLPPVFVPSTKVADEMMREMITRRIHMAFVVDEHGTLMGLLSLDDLIIELVGEIHDDREDSEDIEARADASLVVRAGVDVEDFATETAIVVPQGDYHTLGGFVAHELGRVPDEGDEVEAAGHRFTVVEMEGRRIVTLEVVRVDEGDPALGATADGGPA